MSVDLQSTPVGVLGAGSWGTALGLLIARNGIPVKLWGYAADHVATIQRDRENKRYLPGVEFPSNLEPERSLEHIVQATDHILVVVPSHAFRTTLTAVARFRKVDDRLLISWGTKGFDPEFSSLLSDVVTKIFPAAQLAAVSGPSFATEVAAGQPTALTVASPDAKTANTVADWLRSPCVRVYTNTDLAGVQLGGAIKNVMALAAGISDGLGFGANARAALITRGLAEMNRLGAALGGDPRTFMGLTGVGDLVLTCTDNKSRNKRAGIGLGKGLSLDAVLKDIGQEVEGVKTVHELYAMAQKVSVDMPITTQVYNVVYEGLSPRQAVESLLSREPRAE